MPLINNTDYSQMSVQQLQTLATKGDSKAVEYLNTVFEQSSTSSNDSTVGLKVERTCTYKYNEITQEPPKVERNELASYADKYGENITRDKNGIPTKLIRPNGEEYNIDHCEEFFIGTEWKGWKEESDKCIKGNTGKKFSSLDAMVAYYNDNRPKGVREITREDVAACNSETFGTEGCNKRGTSVDDVANLYVDDKLILPVIYEEGYDSNSKEIPKPVKPTDKITEDTLPDPKDPKSYRTANPEEVGETNYRIAFAFPISLGNSQQEVINVDGLTEGEVTRLIRLDKETTTFNGHHSIVRAEQLLKKANKDGIVYINDTNGDGKIDNQDIGLNIDSLMRRFVKGEATTGRNGSTLDILPEERVIEE